MEPFAFYMDSWSGPYPSARLHGTAVNDHAVIHDTEGLHAYMASGLWREIPFEGRYIAQFDAGCRWVVRTDITGQDLLYVYRQGRHRWAISNSLHVLAGRLRDHGVKLTSYRTALGVPVGGGYLSQPTTHRTAFEEIELLLPTDEVWVSKRSAAMTIRRRPFMSSLDVDPAQPWEAALTEFLEHTLGTMATYMGDSSFVDLSGGYDSRVVFGLTRRLTSSADQCLVYTTKAKRDDKLIAELISDDYGARIGALPAAERNLSLDDGFSLWEAATVGGYLLPYPKTQLHSSSLARFSGDKSIPDGFGRGVAHLNRRVSSHLQTGEDRQRFAGDLTDLTERIGAAPSSEVVDLLYYNVTRSRFHCGRHWWRRMAPTHTVAPLASLRFSRLYLLAARQGRNLKTVLPDVLRAVDPGLLRWGHAEPSRTWEPWRYSESDVSGPLPANPRAKQQFGSPRTEPVHASSAESFTRSDFAERLLDEFAEVRDSVSDLRVVNPTVMEHAIDESQTLATQGGEWTPHQIRNLSFVVHAGKLTSLASSG